MEGKSQCLTKNAATSPVETSCAPNCIGEPLLTAELKDRDTVETLGENVVINFPETQTSEEQMQTMIAQALEALNEARENSGASESEVLFGGIEAELEKLAASMDAAQPQSGEGSGGSSAEMQEKVQNASRTTEELTVALREQIDQGLVAIEQREDSVFITVTKPLFFLLNTSTLTLTS